MKKLFVFIIFILNISSMFAMKHTLSSPVNNTRGALKRRRIVRQNELIQAITQNDVEQARRLLDVGAQMTNQVVRHAIDVGRPEILAMFKLHTDQWDGNYQDGFTPFSLAYALRLRIKEKREDLLQQMRRPSTLIARDLGMHTRYESRTIDQIDIRDQMVKVLERYDIASWEKDLFWALRHDNQEAEQAMLSFIRQMKDKEERECRVINDGDLCAFHAQLILPIIQVLIDDCRRLYQEGKCLRIVTHSITLSTSDGLERTINFQGFEEHVSDLFAD